MNILVVGSGAREHAICWRLANSPGVTKVFCAPGNAGTSSCAENVPLAATAVTPLVHNLTFLRAVLVSPEFSGGRYDTTFAEAFAKRKP